MIELSFNKIFKGLLVTFIILFAAHVLIYFVHLAFKIDHPFFLSILSKFDFDQEQNFPTLFNTLILLISSSLLFVISLQEKKKKEKRLWIGLSMIFLYIGIDDFVMFHERIMFYFPIDIEFKGFFHYSWVIPFGIIALATIAYYLPFVFRLPKKIRNRFILAGAVFITGGLFLEMVGGKIYTMQGNSIWFIVAFTLEETMEMLGILIFIHTLIEYLKMKTHAIAINTSSNGTLSKNNITYSRQTSIEKVEKV